MTKQQWEYAVEPFSNDQYSDQVSDELNDYGKEGWEVVAVLPPMVGDTGFRILFKRPKAA